MTSRPQGVLAFLGEGDDAARADAAREQDEAWRAEELGEDVVSSPSPPVQLSARAGVDARLHLGELYLLGEQ